MDSVHDLAFELEPRRILGGNNLRAVLEDAPGVLLHPVLHRGRGYPQLTSAVYLASKVLLDILLHCAS